MKCPVFDDVFDELGTSSRNEKKKKKWPLNQETATSSNSCGHRGKQEDTSHLQVCL